MKKFMSAVLAALLLLIPCKAYAASQDEGLDEFTRAMSADENLLAAWGTNEDAVTPKYPDYIGGTGFNEAGRLSVYICDDTPSNRKKVETAAGDAGILDFVKVKYSYNELQRVSDEINNDYNAGRLEFTVNFSDVNVEGNVVQVRVRNSDVEKAKRYVKSKYSDKVEIFDGYDVGGEEESATDADSASDSNILLYVNIGIAALSAIAAAVLIPSKKKKPQRTAPKKNNYSRKR